MQVQDDILKLIKEKLPEMQVKVITEVFNENVTLKASITKLKEEVEYLNSIINEKEMYIKNKNEIISTLDTKIREAGNIKQREDSVLKRELRQEVVELKATHANEKAELVKELFKIPFANRVLREDIFHTTQIPVRTPQEVYNYNTGKNELKEKDNLESVTSTKNITVSEE